MIKLSDVLQLLLRLRQSECWCEKGIGNPMVEEHTEECLEAQRIVKNIEQQLQAERTIPISISTG